MKRHVEILLITVLFLGMIACKLPQLAVPALIQPAPTPTPTSLPGLLVPQGYASIQAAIEAASDGDTIIVSPGVYTENIDFTGKAITVRSTKPEDPGIVSTTVIDGAGRGAVVTFQNSEPATVVLTGLTLIKGTFGIVVTNASSPTIRGNTIQYNRPKGSGKDAMPTLEGSGIFITDHSAPAIENNLIADNRCSLLGGGIAILGNSTPSITGNTISRNICGMGSGIFLENSSPIITGNFIIDNTTIIGGSWGSGGGIAISGKSNAQITGNTLRGNSAVVGGGILIIGGSATVTGNTFEKNRATTSGGAIYVFKNGKLILPSPDDNIYTANKPDNVSYEK